MGERCVAGRVRAVGLICGALVGLGALVGPGVGDAQAKRAQILTAPKVIKAGAIASITFDPWDNRSCRVSFTGPRRAKSGPFTRTIKGGVVRMRWRTAKNARRGAWKVAINCTDGAKRTTTSRTIRVHGAARPAHRARLVAPRSVRWAGLPIPGASVGLGSTDGKGAAAGNPFGAKWCTWLAYEMRPDIYRTAVANGVSGSGWNGYQWADKARQAGFPVGASPAVGSIAVFSREYYGGPNRDDRGGQWGHVAYVTAVHADGSFSVIERDGTAPVTKSSTRQMRAGIQFIYGGPAGNGPGSPGAPAPGVPGGTDPVTNEPIALGGPRVAVRTAAGQIIIKEAGLSAHWVAVAGGSDVALSGDRVAVRTGEGKIIVKEGPLDAAWVHVTDGAAVALSGDRIGVRTSDGSLLIKEGPLGAKWVKVASSVERFALSGSRIGIVQSNGQVRVKEGPVNAQWVHVTDGVDVALSGNRVGVRTADSSILIKEGPLNATWTKVATASAFALSGLRIATVDANGQVRVKEGPVNAHWVDVAGARSVALAGERVAIVGHDGRILVKEGPLNAQWVHVTDGTAVALAQ